MQAWEEDAFPLARRLAREEGRFVGMSSGAIAWASLQIARELGPAAASLMISPDSGARYLDVFVRRRVIGVPTSLFLARENAELDLFSITDLWDSGMGGIKREKHFALDPTDPKNPNDR